MLCLWVLSCNKKCFGVWCCLHNAHSEMRYPPLPLTNLFFWLLTIDLDPGLLTLLQNLKVRKKPSEIIKIIYVIFDALIWILTLCKMEANKHLKRNTYTDIYKQEQNLSCETPTTILILISFCPLENKLYISTFCVVRKKVDKICTTLFLTHTGKFAAILSQ